MTSPTTPTPSTSWGARLLDRLLDVLLSNIVIRWLVTAVVVVTALAVALYVLRGPLISTGPPQIEGVRTIRW